MSDSKPNTKPDIKIDRKPRPSPKGTGRNTGCLHTSVILPKDVADAMEEAVWILDAKRNRLGKKTDVSANDIIVKAVRKEMGLPMPNTTTVVVPQNPATEAFSKIIIPTNQ